MSSILKVSEIQDPTNGNSALTINSSGNVHIPGSVVQLAESSWTSAFSTSSTDVAVTNATCNITPKFNNSKILIMLSTVWGMET